MDAAEFRRYRTQAQLSIRKAAQVLGCSPSTIYRWENGQAPIDSTAADEIRRRGSLMTESKPPAESVAYKIGKLTALLAWMAKTEPDTYRFQIDQFPAAGIPKLLAQARQQGARFHAREDELTAIMAEIPADGFPRSLTPEAASNYWLGFYHWWGDQHDSE